MSITIPKQCHYPLPIKDKSKTMICLISDWHIGYKITNCKGNYYNWEIANERVNKLISACQKYVKLYGIERVYVYNLGDLVEHTYMRQTQAQYCEFMQGTQIEKATQLLYRFITALSEMCNVVYDGIAGNHDRYSGEKSENYDGDNVNSTITPLLKTMFEIADNNRVHIIERNYSDKEIINEINGIKCKFVHGDKHSKDDKTKLKNEISMDNEIYNLYCEGHWHNFRCLSENRGRYIVTNGCLSGFNDYSTTFGCATNASQTLIVLSDREIEMIKNVDLQ